MLKRSQRSTVGRAFEALESRHMMAGDVSVRIVAGDLEIRGDDRANAIELVTVAYNEYRVVGRTLDGSATKINGVTNGSFSFFDGAPNSTAKGIYWDDVVIDMRGGSDKVTIKGSWVTNGFFVPGDLNISTSTGNDTVILDYIYADNVSVHLGWGNDNLTASNIVVSNNFTARNAYSATLPASQAKLNLDGIFAWHGRLMVDLTSGGKDSVTIRSSGADDLQIRLYDGDDSLTLDRVSVESKQTVDGGKGFDTLVRINSPKVLRGPGWESLKTFNG